MNFLKNTTFHLLYVSSIQETAEFYTLLWVEIKERTNEKFVFQMWDLEFHAILRTSEPWEEYKVITQLLWSSAIYYVWCDDIHAVYDIAIQNSLNIVSPIRENWWSAQEILLKDPNGYHFSFYQLI